MTATDNIRERTHADKLIRDAIKAALHRKLADTLMAQAVLIATARDPHEMVETLRPAVCCEDFPDSVNNRAMAKMIEMANFVVARRAEQRAESN